MIAVEARTESRGACVTTSQRDDVNAWGTAVFPRRHRLDYKPVRLKPLMVERSAQGAGLRRGSHEQGKIEHQEAALASLTLTIADTP